MAHQATRAGGAHCAPNIFGALAQVGCLELFAGVAGLSAALSKCSVLHIRAPFDCFRGRKYIASDDLRNKAIVEPIVADIKVGRLKYVHLGIPRATWGNAGRLAGYCRRNGIEQGRGLDDKEFEANELVWSKMRICCTFVGCAAFIVLKIMNLRICGTSKHCIVDISTHMCMFILINVDIIFAQVTEMLTLSQRNPLCSLQLSHHFSSRSQVRRLQRNPQTCTGVRVVQVPCDRQIQVSS